MITLTLIFVYLIGIPLVFHIAYKDDTLKGSLIQAILWPVGFIIVFFAWLAVGLLALLGKSDKWVPIGQWLDRIFK